MHQKCIIILVDGTRLEYVGEAQYDTELRPKVKKVQFTVPIDDEPDLEEYDAPKGMGKGMGVDELLNIFGMKK